jgi:hypothetical protein
VLLLEPRADSSTLQEGASLVALAGAPPGTPTGLAVLESDTGLTVLVGSEGQDRVYVFGLPLAIALPLPGEGNPTPKAAPLPGLPLALAVTLEDSFLQEGSRPIPTLAAEEILQASGDRPLLPPAPGKTGLGGTPSGGENGLPPLPNDSSESSPGPTASTEQEEDFRRSTKQRLQGLDARRVDEEDLDRPSPLPAPAPPESRPETEPGAVQDQVWSLESGWLRAPAGLVLGGLDWTEEASRQPQGAESPSGPAGQQNPALLAILGTAAGFRARNWEALLGDWPLGANRASSIQRRSWRGRTR